MGAINPTDQCQNEQICKLIQDQATLAANQNTLDANQSKIEGHLCFETGKFVFVADSGEANSEQASMSTLLESIDPDQVFMGGDNVYGGTTITDALAFLSDRIDAGQVWPCWGNHDWDDNDLDDILAEFPYLPYNKRSYNIHFNKGNLELILISNDDSEPDGVAVDGDQYTYIHTAINNSTARWKVAMFHHPPFTPRTNASDPAHFRAIMQDWPGLQEMDLILVGHGHMAWAANWDATKVINCSTGVRDLRPFSVSQTVYGATEGQAGLLYQGDESGRHLLKLHTSSNRLTAEFLRHEGNPGSSPLIDYAIDIS